MLIKCLSQCRNSYVAGGSLTVLQDVPFVIWESDRFSLSSAYYLIIYFDRVNVGLKRKRTKTLRRLLLKLQGIQIVRGLSIFE